MGSESEFEFYSRIMSFPISHNIPINMLMKKNGEILKIKQSFGDPVPRLTIDSTLDSEHMP